MHSVTRAVGFNVAGSPRNKTIYKMYLKLIALLLLSVCLNAGSSKVPLEKPEKDNNRSTLQLVHLIFRHGPRTPVSTYPKDPYLNETYEPYGWGQLTNGAKVELFQIGKQLRKRYKNYLPSYYQANTLHAQATQSQRTIMSLQTVLAGLFPPKNTPMEWNKQLNWQPIPIVIEPESIDKRLRQNVPCPRYEEAVWEVMHSPEVLALHKEYAELLGNLTELTGFNSVYAHDVANIMISLQTQQAYGLPIPKWAKDYYPDKMLPLAAKAYIYDAFTTEQRKIKAGFFLEDVYKQMQNKISGDLSPAERKMYIYCVHDWSIANILNALDLWQYPQMPRFSALIAFELHKHKDSENYFVEIYFQNDPSKPPQLMQVPGCDKQCPIEKLMELSKSVLPDAPFEELCVAKGVEGVKRISYH